DAAWVELQPPPKQLNRFGRRLLVFEICDQCAPAHNQIHHVPIAVAAAAARLAAHQLNPYAARQAADNLVLELQDVSALLIEAVGPQVLVGRGVDQLHIDADPCGIDENAALQHIAHAEFRADLPDRHRTAPVGEGGGAGNDEAAGQTARQIRYQRIDNAIDEG